MIKYLISSFDEIGQGSDETAMKSYECGYIKKYRDTLTGMARTRDWKYSGEGAAFTHSNYNPHAEDDMSGAVSDVCAGDNGCRIYSARVGGVSGIIKMEPETDKESHIIHSNSQVFGSVEFSLEANNVLTSVSNGGIVSDIALFDIGRGDLKLLTSGDSIDEFPSFSKFDGSVLFNSRGIGRNQNMEAVALSESELLKINPSGEIKEVLAEKGYDLFAPKDDRNGNLYYLRKPAKNIKRGKGVFGTLLDIILLPFWLLYGLVRVLVFLGNTAKNDKKKKNKDPFSHDGGVNPAVNRASNNTININGEEIDLSPPQKDSKNDKDGEEKGFAPEHFELWRMNVSGGKEKLRGGVLGFDINADGAVILTDGRNVFLRGTDGVEKKLHRGRAIIRVRFDEPAAAGFSLSPF